MLKKILLGLVLVVAIVVAGGGAYLTWFLPSSRPAPAISVGSAPDLLARGRYLFDNVLVCSACHGERDYARYGGPLVSGLPVNGECFVEATGFPGHLCAPNLTPGPGGIGEWTDGEILRALREGVSRDGHGLFPIMPYDTYKHLSDADAMAVVAYLRTLPPAPSTPPERTIPFPEILATKFAPQPVESVAGPDMADPIARGRYLATVGNCLFCHTPVTPEMMPVPGMDFAGGQEFPFAEGYRVVSSNLTPHDSGIGYLSEENFVDLFRAYVEVDEVAVETPFGVNTPMPWYWYSGMTDDDLRAIYAFLRTVPPVENVVDNWPDRER